MHPEFQCWVGNDDLAHNESSMNLRDYSLRSEFARRDLGRRPCFSQTDHPGARLALKSVVLRGFDVAASTWKGQGEMFGSSGDV